MKKPEWAFSFSIQERIKEVRCEAARRLKIENKRQNQDADKKRVRNGGNEDERDHDMCDRRCSDRGRVVGSRKRIIFASKKKGETKK